MPAADVVTGMDVGLVILSAAGVRLGATQDPSRSFRAQKMIADRQQDDAGDSLQSGRAPSCGVDAEESHQMDDCIEDDPVEGVIGE